MLRVPLAPGYHSCFSLSISPQMVLSMVAFGFAELVRSEGVKLGWKQLPLDRHQLFPRFQLLSVLPSRAFPQGDSNIVSVRKLLSLIFKRAKQMSLRLQSPMIEHFCSPLIIGGYLRSCSSCSSVWLASVIDSHQQPDVQSNAAARRSWSGCCGGVSAVLCQASHTQPFCSPWLAAQLCPGDTRQLRHGSRG